MRRPYIFTTVIVAILLVFGYAGWRWWPEISIVYYWLRPGASVKFAVVGDNHGDTPIYREILADVAQDKVMGLLNLADTSEHGTREELTAVKKVEQAQPYPVWHVVGSHDIKTDPTRQTFIDVFGGQPCQAVTVKNVRLLLLDNADRLTGFTDQCLSWLRTELTASPTSPTILAYHRSFNLPLSSLVGDDETSASRRTNTELLSIISAYHNIRYIFSAHLHTYLSYKLNGVPTVISGGGGNPAQAVLGGSRNNYFHYLLVTVRGDRVTTSVRRVQLSD